MTLLVMARVADIILMRLLQGGRGLLRANRPAVGTVK